MRLNHIYEHAVKEKESKKKISLFNLVGIDIIKIN